MSDPSPTPDQKELQRRAAWVASLRQVADIWEAHPELALPLVGTSTWLPMHLYAGDRTDMAAIARALPGPHVKHASNDDPYFRLTGQVGTLHWTAAIEREQVCERVVVGTREVTETVPDPAAALVEVTRVVDEVQWKCGPLLADSALQAAVYAIGDGEPR